MIQLRPYGTPDTEIAKSIAGLEESFGSAAESGEEALDEAAYILEILDVKALNIASLDSASMQQLDGSIDCLFGILSTIAKLRKIAIVD